jgi:prevent-host-death family protein
MKRVTTAAFARRLADYIREVEDGETLVLTRRGRPVARLQPALWVRPPLKPFSEIAHRRYPKLDLPINSTELLAIDHGHGDPTVAQKLSPRRD